MNDIANVQEMLYEIDERARPLLQKEGIIVPSFDIKVRPMQDFEVSLTQYYREFMKTTDSPFDLNEALFVQQILSQVQDAHMIESPLAGEDGTIYVNTLPEDDFILQYGLLHTHGHVIQRALHWHNNISLPYNQKGFRTAEIEYLKEGFATWYALTLQEIGKYILSIDNIWDIHADHQGSQYYWDGFKFYNFIASRYQGMQTVFDTVRRSHGVPLQNILDPSLFSPDRVQDDLARAYMLTGDDDYVRDIKRMYGDHMAMYAAQHGLFISSRDTQNPQNLSYGFVLHGHHEDREYSIEIPIGQYSIISPHIAPAYTLKFEDEYVSKIFTKDIMAIVSAMGVSKIHLGGIEAKDGPLVLEHYNRSELVLDNGYIVTHTFEEIKRDLMNPNFERYS